MKEYFPSKVDWWVIAVCLAGPFVSFIVVLVIARTGTVNDVLITLVLVFATVGFVAWILLSTNYRFKNTALIIRSGPFRWNIPVREIVSVTRTRSPWSSPALSLDRIRIEYGSPRREIIISPRDQAEFFAALEGRLPADRGNVIRR